MTIDFEKAAAQADLCRLLAACYYEPGPEFAEERVFDSIVAAATRVDASLVDAARQMESAFAAESAENLLVDYARLFLGPSGTLAPPYESAWRDKNSDSPLASTLSLVELYDQGGFEMDPEFRDLPDHLAVELEFLYTLLFRIAAAVRDNDEKARAHALALHWPLLEQHLSCWIDPFAAAVSEHAGCDFYRRLAELTRSFVSMEARRAGGGLAGAPGKD